ncbi:MAG TPA: hypothetical protein VKP69_02495 [Isosphaeraceae bacterium]|nr:hypothetical protein [Isosphaeraceae bacterium]
MSPPQTTSSVSCCPRAVSDLRLQAHQRLDSLLDFCLADEPSRCFLAFEKALLGLLFFLGQILVQLFLRHRQERLDLTAWLSRGYRVSDAYAPRTLKTAFGPVEYGRAYLVPPEGNGPGVHPLDVALGLTRDSFSPLLIGWFCRLATCLSFRLSSELGGMFLGWAPAPSAIEEWVQGLGRPAYVYLSSGPLPANEGEVLVMEFDGKAAPTATEHELAKRKGKRRRPAKACPHGCQRHRGRACRRRHGRKKRRKKGDKSKNGRSATLVVMSTLRRGDDSRLHGPCNKKVYGTFGSRKKALAWAREQATRRGFPPDTTQTVQIVVDGELCLEQRLRQLFPQAIMTLDVRHAQEKLWQVGRLFHVEGSDELAAWVEPLEALLYQGEVAKLLERLRQELGRVARRGPGTKAQRKKLSDVIAYLGKRQGMMAYGQWRKQDLVIASGVVEGAARYVVGERLDNSGMRWVEERAEAVLLLRCIEVNGDWDDFWDGAERQRRVELNHGLAVQIRSKVPTQLPEAA